MDTRFHIGLVIFPLTHLRSVLIEGIGIGVEIDALELAQDDTADEFCQFGVIVGKLYVGPHLCSRVAQPHGGNVACIDKSIIITIHHAIVDCRLQCVWKAILEHPCQIGVSAELLLHLFYLLVDDL